MYTAEDLEVFSSCKLQIGVRTFVTQATQDIAIYNDVYMELPLAILAAEFTSFMIADPLVSHKDWKTILKEFSSLRGLKEEEEKELLRIMEICKRF